MARDRIGARKPSAINPDIDTRPGGGDSQLLWLTGIRPVENPGPITSAASLAGGTYTQNFDSLAISGTTNVTVPTGWAFAETGANANGTYAAGTGTSTGGDTYSYGIAGVHVVGERAFGGLQSSTLVPTIGAGFTNGSGGTITSLAISYFGEQWRLG